jgi:hypothetical protein
MGFYPMLAKKQLLVLEAYLKTLVNGRKIHNHLKPAGVPLPCISNKLI